MSYEVTQDQANELLYLAYDALKSADMFFEIDPSDNYWMGFEEKARAYYNAWTIVTGIEFERGYLDLHNFTDDDFKSFNSGERNTSN